MPSRNSEYSRAFRNVDLEPISEFRSNFRTLSDKFFQGDQTVRKIFRVVDCSESTDFLVFSQGGASRKAFFKRGDQKDSLKIQITCLQDCTAKYNILNGLFRSINRLSPGFRPSGSD